MKKTALLTLLPSAAIAIMAFSSCTPMDPEYKAWKAKQTATAAATPYTTPAAGANPYGVPQPAGEAGTYTPAPYQPIPGVAQNTAPTTTPYTPSPSSSTAPIAAGGSHTVVAGDSLWGLAKQYGSSIEEIQAANNLTNTIIRTGQTLIIPGN